MDSESKTDKSDEDSSTKCVLDYYHKYSQSKKLPKYFSGSSLSYLPEIVKNEDENINVGSRIATDQSVQVILPEEVENINIDTKFTSDQIIEELLSPTGSTSHKKLEWDNLADIGYDNAESIHRTVSLPIISHPEIDLSNSDTKSNKCSGSSNVKLIIYPYTSSSDEKSQENYCDIPSTSSQYSKTSKNQHMSSSSTSSDCVKNNSSSSESPSDKIWSFKQSLDTLKSKIGLPVDHSTPSDFNVKAASGDNISSTPFLVKQDKPVKNILSGLEIKNPTNVNVGIQSITEDEGSRIRKKCVNLCLTKPLLIDCVSNNDAIQLTKEVQTENTTKPSNITNSEEDVSSNGLTSICDSFEYIKNNDNTNDVKKSSLESSKPISDVGDDPCDEFQKRIYVLQKLLKSKKYDSAAKKKYTKKILQKIIESKYLEDSSTSSDLFYPKSDQFKTFPDHTKAKHVETTSTSQSPEEQKTPKKKIKNLESLSPKKSTIENTSKVPLKEKGPFTLTKKTTNSFNQLSLESSETLKGDGDHLMLNFADKERQYQLNWIDREINHLGKLKSLLTKPKDFNEQSKNIKTTTVYMVSGSDNESKKRNFVIETNIPGKSSQPRTFCVNGENFIVCQPNKENQPKHKKCKASIADIKVQSDDQTTNIKVTTVCRDCRQAPCVCDIHSQNDNFSGSSKSSRYKRCQEDISKSNSCCSNNLEDIESDKSSECLCFVDKCDYASKVPVIPVKTYMQGNNEEETEVCLCDVLQSENGSSSSNDNIGSLGKIFKNCSCDPQNECNCGFVDKLMKYFYKKPDSCCNCQNIKDPKNSDMCIQVMVPTRDCDVQTQGTKSSENSEQSSKRENKCNCPEPNSCQCRHEESQSRRESNSSSSKNSKFISSKASKFASPSNEDDKNICNCPDQNCCQCKIDEPESNSSSSKKSKLTSNKTSKITSPSIEEDNICNCSDPNCCQCKLDENESNSSSSKKSKFTTSKINSPSNELDINKCTPEYLNILVSKIEKALQDKQCQNRNKGSNKKSSDMGTNYSPPMSDCLGSPKAKSTSPKFKTPDLVDDCTCCTNETCFVNKTTETEKNQVKSTKIDSNEYQYNPAKSKNEKGSLSVQLSKDVKSVDMSFCLCASKKNKCECPCDKKKKQHKKQQHCKCSKNESSNDSTSKGESKHNEICRCKCGNIKKKYVCCCKDSSNDETSSSLSTTSSNSATPMVLCTLCNRTATADKMSVLRTKDEEYLLCSKCVAKKPILTSSCYIGPETDPEPIPTSGQPHVVSDFIQSTETYCTCSKGTLKKNKRFEYCKHCQSQLRKTLKNKNGIAYTLTLDDNGVELDRKRRIQKKAKMSEIRVKVPNPYNRKKINENENIQRRNKNKADQKNNDDSDEELKISCGSCDNETKINKNSTNKTYEGYTLQEYLMKNRPDFIDSAEYRRQAVLNNKIEREQIKDDMKLHFLKETENNVLKRQNRLFSEREMREITKRNYKKLPEVQQKLNNIKLQKLRNADRYITDVFKKKIQNCVLKGKSRFPIDSNIINYYK